METVATIGHSNRSIEDIIGPQTPKPHKLTTFAQVEGTRITYPSDTQLQDEAQGSLPF
jgi:hypothetical protein